MRLKLSQANAQGFTTIPLRHLVAARPVGFSGQHAAGVTLGAPCALLVPTAELAASEAVSRASCDLALNAMEGDAGAMQRMALSGPPVFATASGAFAVVLINFCQNRFEDANPFGQMVFTFLETLTPSALDPPCFEQSAIHMALQQAAFGHDAS